MEGEEKGQGMEDSGEGQVVQNREEWHGVDGQRMEGEEEEGQEMEDEEEGQGMDIEEEGEEEGQGMDIEEEGEEKG